MDVVKVFVEDPAALGGGSALRSHLRPTDDSAEAFLASLRAPTSFAARAYLAGTRLGERPDEARPVVGLTAVEPAAWADPLLAWAGPRAWTRLTTGGRATGVLDREAREALARPDGTLALALGPGPIPADILTTVVLGDVGLSADALQTLLLADASVAVLLPEPAHDGHDWSVVARSPDAAGRGLRDALAAAFRACPAPAGVRRYLLPRVRGESKFYFEQWAETLPAGAEAV